MSEEKKEINPVRKDGLSNGVKPQTPKEEAPKAEVPNVEAPKTEAPKVDTPKAKTAKEEKKKEKPANCAVCNKSIKKKRYYYRNGKHYCTKRCWKTTIKKDSKEAPEKPTAPEAKG